MENIIKKRLNQKVIETMIVDKLQSDKVEQCIYKQGRLIEEINITKEMFYE